jgi:pimeloyl-ACP methyl ester carboxylesterase
MSSISVPAQPTAAAPTLMVWLPGAYHTAQDFLAAGFAAAVQTRRLALDLKFVDMDLQHLGDRSVLQRVRSDMVLPARAAGVSIWLGGISLGGLFALDYAASYPDELDGLCLLAPYLGNRMLTAEIAQAPGLAAWQPGELAETDEERRIWRYIKNRRADSRPLYLGFGQADRFSAAHELLAATLPADAVDVIAGDHQWSTWARLWENFLDSRFR